MLSRKPGTLFDFGSSFFAIVAAAVVGVAALQFAALLYINNKWPPIPLEVIQQEATGRANASLQKMDRANMLLQVNAASLQRWLAPEVQNAVKRINEGNKNLHIQIEDLSVNFDAQRAIIRADFEVRLLDHGIVIIGAVEGLGYLSLDGKALTVSPALSAMKVRSVKSESGRSWWVPAVANLIFAQLSMVRDNINGQLTAYVEQLPVSPITLPSEPRHPIPVTFPDPFRPGQTVTSTFVAPVLKAAALLSHNDRITVLAQLSLDEVASPLPSPPQPVDFQVYRRNFAQKLEHSGLRVNPESGVGFDVAESFVQDLFQRYTGQVFTRDRISQAIKASYEALPRLGSPSIAASLDAPTVTNIVRTQMERTLANWASTQSGTITASAFEVRPQHFWATASASFPVPQVGAHLDASVTIAVPASGLQSGIRLYPAIDELKITKLTSSSFGDLPGLLRGINVFLAGAIGAANTALKPVDAGVDPLGVPSFSVQ